MTIKITATIEYEKGEPEATPETLARTFTTAARKILRNRARIEREAARAIAAATPRTRRRGRTQLHLPMEGLEKAGRK